MMKHAARPSTLHGLGFACLIVLWVSLTGAHALQQSTWRPFANRAVLVTLGMSKGEVLLKAGEPDLADVMSRGIYHLRSITVWTYIRTGHNAAIATLTFNGNILTKIEIKIVHS
jgi:hypothetical protein